MNKAQLVRRFVQAMTFVVPAAPVAAQSYPSHAIRLIVPFPAGQSADLHARMIADNLAKSLGQQVVVDNKGGASGMIGAELAARAAPDGYTIVYASSGPFGINPAIFPKLSYDPVRDFAAISQVAYQAQVMVVAPAAPAATVQDMVALVKSKQGGFNYASSGSGTTNHLTMEMLRARLGLDLHHVPYKGGPPALVDTMAGSILVMFDTITAILPHVKGGRLRALAVSTAQRSEALPNVPTVAESVAPGFEVTGWGGLAAPAKTPPLIVRLLHAEVVKFLARPEVKKHLADMGQTAVGDTPEQFGAFIQSEVAKWTWVARDSGAKAD